MNNIREHLCHAAQEVSERLFSALPSLAEWPAVRERIRAQYLEMLGLLYLPAEGERPPLNVCTTSVLHREGYRVEKILYESLPRLYVTGNLYVPEKLTQPAPAVVYFCGHREHQKVAYQAHPRKWCQLGFVTLLVESIQLGEIRGYHHGTFRRGWFNWLSRGYSPAGVECLNGIRALDLLQGREEVDREQIGVTGISGGGATSWWVGAADERVKVAAPVCGTGTVERHVREKTVDFHCDCMFLPNFHRLDLTHIAALIAPRPVLIASADRDALFSLAAIREFHARLAQVYELLGAPENLKLLETPGEHGYHELACRHVFSWFIKHLMGKEVTPEEVGSVDADQARQERAEDLLVLKSGPPRDEMNTIVQDWFIPLPEQPEIQSPQELAAHREAMRDRLFCTTFSHFPPRPCPLELETEMEERQSGPVTVRRMKFNSEADWRLSLTFSLPDEVRQPARCFVILRSPGEFRRNTAQFWSEALSRCASAVLETRGTGDTAWGEELCWHLRRSAALTGRTVASMRVWDVLRGLEAVRSLAEVNPNEVCLVAQGEMVAVALMAALLDGGILRVAMQGPPATLNASSSPDGRGEACEMLGVLRTVNLPAAAGMLWPAELVFVGERPKTYKWTDDLYTRLGPPGRLLRLSEVGDWRPED